MPTTFLADAARRRRPWLPGVLTLLLLAAAVPAASAGVDATAGLPLLWQGQVADAGGRPAVATVYAAVRPPAAAIPSQADVERALGEGREPVGLPSVPLAEATTDRLGRFELRAAMPALPAGYAPDGVAVRYRQGGRLKEQVFRQQVFVCTITSLDHPDCPGHQDKNAVFGDFDDEVRAKPKK